MARCFWTYGPQVKGHTVFMSPLAVPCLSPTWDPKLTVLLLWRLFYCWTRVTFIRTWFRDQVTHYSTLVNMLDGPILKTFIWWTREVCKVYYLGVLQTTLFILGFIKQQLNDNLVFNSKWRKVNFDWFSILIPENIFLIAFRPFQFLPPKKFVVNLFGIWLKPSLKTLFVANFSTYYTLFPGHFLSWQVFQAVIELISVSTHIPAMKIIEYFD